ncbi:response regulator transcription factor [Pelagibacterium halotolerans]|uniref:Two component transcriptional regulator, LuxR family protein n=1 Tax=Pelagibacterium halotolerans (strain DSM 22347 / JCM 15775 / CGMCC 1.7692 / B2) TaxID=1082931 RepID=G4R9K6_PELHB|nr:response regulator transcription factor [Pelagibacterium halotolerans]AEQ50426.1 two component transcriptional regulator, LuxR family protein [Pelagibacterium halotolerans B2]QJR19607.1 response regulator transcription factor [Pelagibacterium halotolerans]SDZ86841.1 two component transcriptional regulator, LuxR family [Pelagibacterium halotolerans]
MNHRIIIVDDHPLFRAALRQTLEGRDGGMVFEEAGDIEGLSAALEANRDCDLVLLDLNMPGVRGFSGLLLLRAQFPEVPVMIVSAVEDTAVIRRCFDLGASGFLSKSETAARIRESIDTILAGGLWVPDGVSLDGHDEQTEVLGRLATLTPQQIRVLMMLSDGLMNKQIAYELSISEATVKAHVSAILQKLNVDSRTQAVIAAAKIEQGQFAQLVEDQQA